MTPFNPLDGDIQWDVRRGIEASQGYVGIFGTDSAYEAFLFILAVEQRGGDNLIASGKL